jgi:hypothetical protein
MLSRDENVLKFSVGICWQVQEQDSANEIDIQVEEIDVDELIGTQARLEKIVDYIIAIL